MQLRTGVKALATLLVGHLKPPDDDWRSAHFSDIESDDAAVDGARLLRFLLHDCTFTYIVHTVKTCSLAESRAPIGVVSEAAAAAAAALGETRGAYAGTPADHAEYTRVFKANFDTLVRFSASCSFCLVAFEKRAEFS